MKLWLDAGNTRLKWQLCHNDELILQDSVVHKGNLAEAIKTIAQDIDRRNLLNKLECVTMASVLSEAVMDLAKASALDYLFLPLRLPRVEKHFLGLDCAYEDVSRFGVDRWLALLASFNKLKAPVCVVSCGTAITVDVVLASGRHLGGYIVPGLFLAKKSLLGNTDRVRFVNDEQDDIPIEKFGLGTSTQSAVNNGVLFQAQAMINQVWNYCQELDGFSDGALILTGGDAAQLAQSIEIPFTIEDDLVLQGLRLHSRV